MDYEIKPTSRKELRLYAKLFRSICGYSMDEPIDPITILEKLRDYEGFGDVSWQVVSDNELPKNVPAICTPNENGYHIEIKNSVYQGAYENNIGGYRMHIIHEIMHVFLDKLGFKPVFSRRVKKDPPAYCRLEWAVKAIAGEVMMPYEATHNLTERQIIDIYGVSKDAAHKRLTY